MHAGKVKNGKVADLHEHDDKCNHDHDDKKKKKKKKKEEGPNQLQQLVEEQLRILVDEQKEKAHVHRFDFTYIDPFKNINFEIDEKGEFITSTEEK